MKKSQIYIDDSGTVHVSYQCDSCSEWVQTDEHCGYGEDYLCPDCFVPATSPEDKEHAMAIDPHAVNCDVSDLSEDMCAEFLRGLGFDVQKRSGFEDDWLIFTDNPIGCTIAVHKSMAGRRANLAQSAVCEPREGVTRFGPGSLSLSMTSIDDLHFDVHHVHTLWDEGYLNDECIKIFGGAK